MDISNKIIFVAALVAITLAASGCVRFADFLTEEEITYMKACMKEEQEEIPSAIDFDEKEFSQKDYCYFQLAEDSKNPDICKEIKHAEMKNDCLYSYAMMSGNPENCERIENSALRYNCNTLLGVKKLSGPSY